jgi:RimJ/RimL family protein N-acetyltransferase
MRSPLIEYGPLTLRAPGPADVPWIYHACQDEDIQRFTTIPSPYTPDHAVGWVGQAAALCAEDREFHFLISVTETGELLGSAGLRRTDDARRGEIGYWVERDSRRRGAATRAVLALERWAATTLALEETFLRIADGNEASMAVARRCGYEVVGPDLEPCKGLPVIVFRKSLAVLEAQAASD